MGNEKLKLSAFLCRYSRVTVGIRIANMLAVIIDMEFQYTVDIMIIYCFSASFQCSEM